MHTPHDSNVCGLAIGHYRSCADPLDFIHGTRVIEFSSRACFPAARGDPGHRRGNSPLTAGLPFRPAPPWVGFFLSAGICRRPDHASLPRQALENLGIPATSGDRLWALMGCRTDKSTCDSMAAFEPAAVTCSITVFLQSLGRRTLVRRGNKPAAGPSEACMVRSSSQADPLDRHFLFDA